jgi:hypothetical protein
MVPAGKLCLLAHKGSGLSATEPMDSRDSPVASRGGFVPPNRIETATRIDAGIHPKAGKPSTFPERTY